MTTTLRRSTIVFDLLLLLLAPGLASGQNTRPVSHTKGLTGPMIGIHYGVPLKWSALLAIPLPGGSDAGGSFVAAEPGIGGWRASAGYLRILGDLGSGYALRATYLHTGNRAWRAPPGVNYVGGEFQYMPLFVLGVRFGAFARVKGPGQRRGLLTADFSLML
jgi:hypothetical protein